MPYLGGQPAPQAMSHAIVYQGQTPFWWRSVQYFVFLSSPIGGIGLKMDPPFFLHDTVPRPLTGCTTVPDFGLRPPSVSTGGGGVTVFNGFIYFCIQTESKKLVETVGLF